MTPPAPSLMVTPSIPVAGMAIILGVDRFMSMCRATVNIISNGVATLVVSRWDKELDAETLRANLAAVTGGGTTVKAAQPV
jgi:aerobic C4-dicarboxylate transport protein